MTLQHECTCDGEGDCEVCDPMGNYIDAVMDRRETNAAEGLVKMQLKALENENVSWPSHPEYKKDKPADRALVVSDGKQAHCIDHIGPAIDYWLNELGLGADEWQGTPIGVWIWEGSIVVTGGGWFEDRDEELVGEFRALTEAEWSDFHLDGQGPWDSDDWVSTYIGPPEVSREDLESLLEEARMLLSGKDEDLDRRISAALEA